MLWDFLGIVQARSVITILAEGEIGSAYPKACLDVLPGLQGLCVEDGDLVVSVQLKVLDLGDIIEGERCKRVLQVQDSDVVVAADDESTAAPSDLAVGVGRFMMPECMNGRVGLVQLRYDCDFVRRPLSHEVAERAIDCHRWADMQSWIFLCLCQQFVHYGGAGGGGMIVAVP